MGKSRSKVAEVTAVYLPGVNRVGITVSANFLDGLQDVLNTIVNGKPEAVRGLFSKEAIKAASALYDQVGDCTCSDCIKHIGEEI